MQGKHNNGIDKKPYKMINNCILEISYLLIRKIIQYKLVYLAIKYLLRNDNFTTGKEIKGIQVFLLKSP